VKIKNLLKASTEALSKEGFENGYLETRILLEHVLKKPRTWLLTHFDEEISVESHLFFQEFLKRRLAHEPVSKILGHKEFWSLDFKVNEHTLDPRPDSECLIETVLACKPQRNTSLKILDIGTGSGCLIISLLKEYPHALGFGVDLSVEALKIASQNRLNHQLEDRLLLLNSNLAGSFQGPTFDVIISNPPYIESSHIQDLDPEVRLYDPAGALDGGKDGLLFYRLILKQAKNLLNPYGILVLEHGMGQSLPILQLGLTQGFQNFSIIQDLKGLDRCLIFFV
jgi:release factor glutamine methyltransferase